MAPPRKKKCLRNIKKQRRNRRANESDEQRERRLAADASRRASQSKEQHKARLAADVVRRASQSEEKRKARVAADAIRRSKARGRECEESRQRRILGDWVCKENSAFAYDEIIHYSEDPLINIGRMTVTCNFCQALKWKGETPGMCCSNGKVQLPPLIDPPEPLMTLLTANSTEGRHFQSNVRKYNSCFQMTSFGSTKQIKERGFMPTFKIQGQVYHQIGSLQPLPDEEPKFLQIYFVANKEYQTEQRCRKVLNVDPQIVKQLQEMFHEVNSYVRSFKCAMEKMTPEMKIVIHADKIPVGEHERRFNAPISSEVAVVLAGEQTGNRDISLEMRSNIVKKIADSHRSYDALQYPLIFWQGEDGYNFNIKQINPKTRLPTTKKISAMNFYSYRMMFRASNFNIILRFKELFQQFAVDMYAKIESERLRYIRFNQKQLRAEEYIHLKDAINNDANVSDLGQLIILPSSFTGGPRYMHECTQDALTYVKNFGKPDLFITFTCNPKWEEINVELLQGQKSHDRHDIVARVFRQKLKMLLDLINKGKIFGAVGCYMYTVEWQKRGLPHVHILVWLKEKIHVDRVDHLIRAEIPNAETDPHLHDIITKQMIHGPCGSINPLSSCMKNGKCTKRYPRQLLQETRTDTDGYPLYRRRSPDNGGYTTIIKVKGMDVQVDNRWVVPYCPLLSKAFNAHINLEFCSSVKSIKYICKYVNKGSDMAMFTIETDQNELDEVQKYEIGRYISSNEAIWRIFSFPIHERHPTVVHLNVHLENGQRVYFTTENAVQRAIAPQNTTLTAFFDLCRNDEFARRLLYDQLPKFYTWDASRKKWNRRIKGQIVPEFPGIRSTDALGRIYTVHPNNSECFHLRMLLHEVIGPTSFDALKTVDGVVAETFKQACQLRGLLEDDAQWHRTLKEAATTRSPGMLRCLFAVMLQTCAMSNPLELWFAYREFMAEDLLYRARIVSGNIDLSYDDDIFNTALILIEDKVRVLGGSELKVFGLPQTTRESVSLNYDLMRETSYNVCELTSFIESNEPNLVADQQVAYRKITSCVFDDTGGIFFIDAPGGTGKTFLINLLLAKVRQRKLVALAVASSGIAATLLTGGRTAHSVFKLPLNLANIESPTCNISRDSLKAKVMQECKLIVWDECTMSHKAAFEALDVTMQDLRHNNRIMGGAVLVLSGDFRQTLPVITRGTKADEIHACIQRSYLWKDIQHFQLTTNMRVYLYGDTEGQEFAELLLQIGNGEMHYDTTDGMISLENVGMNVDTLQQLIDKVFPNITQHFRNPKWLCERAILAPRNDSVDVTNKNLLAKLPGSLQLYRSIDSVIDVNDSVHYPPEILNKLELSGVPPHRLELKVGAPIMLLRNLDPPTLCNGTRLIVKKLFPNVIEATIMAGHDVGKDVFIPRIPIIPSDLPIQFKRIQFPVRLSFAMSINKAQGQSLKVVGLDLQSPCFSHGQLYVGCSRVGNKKNLFLLAPNGKTKNVVYQEVLRSMSAENVIDVKQRKSIHEKVAVIYQNVENVCVEKHNEEMENARETPCEENIKQTAACDILLQNGVVCNSAVRKIDNLTGENSKNKFSTIRGFTNDHFECYANSLIQCLYQCDDLKSKFFNFNTEIQIHVLAYANDKSVNTKIFRQLARRCYLDIVNPCDDVLFTDGSQEDVFEFLNYLAQALPFLLYEFSYTRHTKLQCLNCFHEVVLHDMDSVIRIHIPTCGNCFNFKDLVTESVSSVEYFEHSCDFCGLSRTRKEDKLMSPPNYLIIQMMIFTTQGKITDYKLLGVPTACLNIHDGVYEVMSGIFHYGDSSHRGHYSSYHRLEDGWYHANDEYIVKQDWPTYSENLYFLLLKRVSSI